MFHAIVDENCNDTALAYLTVLPIRLVSFLFSSTITLPLYTPFPNAMKTIQPEHFSDDDSYEYYADKLARTGRLTPAEHYVFAHFVPFDWEEVAVAEHYLRHVCRAARSGYVHALYQLSFVFEYGDYGAAKDAALARRLMGICARKQHPNAIFHAAWQARGEAERRQLILLAARKRSQAAYLYLADCHAKGRDGFRQNRRLATFYKKRAWADGTWTV